jgi:hypothetical protein
VTLVAPKKLNGVKNSNDNISNGSVSKKPSSNLQQTKYEITGPQPQNMLQYYDSHGSVGELDSKKRSNMFNHFEARNEAAFAP